MPLDLWSVVDGKWSLLFLIISRLNCISMGKNYAAEDPCSGLGDVGLFKSSERSSITISRVEHRYTRKRN